jgi:hypothetical protein
MSASFDPKFIKFSKVASSTLLTGLVSYWKMGEASGTIVDSTGTNSSSANTGTYGNAGKLGNCITYSAGQLTTLSNISGFGMNRTGAYSIALWMKVTASLGAFAMLIGAAIANDAPSLYLAASAGDPQYALRFATENNTTEATSDPVFTHDVWYHIIMVKNGTAVTLYINGSSVGTGTESNAYVNDPLTPATIFIGSDGAGSDFIGAIDEVGVWSKALSAGEIAELYNSGTGKTYPFS